MTSKIKPKNRRSQAPVEIPVVKDKTLKHILFKVAICLCLMVSVVYYTDSKGFFNPDYSNDHTRRKWNAYYDFTKQHDVDVVLVGNSHLYTGISPENLSTALGANCFILASPGTTLTDTYFCLKEAIKVCKPKIAVVETFTIDNYSSHDLKQGTLADQLKSFSARKDVAQKLFSTPILFSSGNILPAWSNSVRNHSFIFTDKEQIAKNIDLLKSAPPENSGLYLGRFIRFTSGLEDSTLMKYNKPGFAAYDGREYKMSDEAKEYIRKTVELCKENNVQLVFLTLPMYHQHVRNYELCKAKFKKEFEAYQPFWLDLQMPYDTAAFTPACFENTVARNQHMTYQGSLVAAYKLAHFIRQKCSDQLPDRSSDLSWKHLFYANDGYFQNRSPENDGVSKILLRNVLSSDGLKIKELDFIQQQSGNVLLLKIDKQATSNLYGAKMQVVVEARVGGKQFMIPVELLSSPAYDPIGHYLFSSSPLRNDVDVVSVKSVGLKL